ncbi:MAG: Stk1 family PASTA domain-containing Ser/Thr kinase [Clostridia bacterium]|nr:Stk1 family PASTA domain-containing Ser/Thr kinase [Clostridia bacterium]
MDNYLNQIIGNRYQIQEIIGIGGMSVVYKAYDPVDDRIVAVKILKDEYLANQEFRMRFKNESKAISMLSHPNIVKVYDVSFGDALQYIVMEYVEGITLKEYIQRQRVLDWKEAVHFVIQILRALQHAHDKGIIHRDIKPQNIILLPNANIKVTDFGIARFNRSEARNVAETSAIGSVHYVSPEQAKGEYTDGRSDIYSVGVVLYEMLTGRVPFESKNDLSVAMMQLKNEAPRPTSINPSIPAGLEQITLRALQKAPADRYQSAAEFLSDLAEFKKNPRMRFDYDFFVDKEPTKYIAPATGAAAAGASQRAAAAKTATRPAKADKKRAYDEDDDDDDDEIEVVERSATVPILLGVGVVLAIIAAVFYFFNPFGDKAGEKVEVPNFINMTFDEAKAKYPEFNFADPQTVYNTTYEPNKVIDQEPKAGEQINKGDFIQLTIAITSEMEKISDVKGMNYEDAEKVLRDSGFDVQSVKMVDQNASEGEVVYTDPAINTYAKRNSTVFIYYATGANNSKHSTIVPSVMGDTLTVAKAKIAAANLKVGSIIYEASSASLKDYVIRQSPSAGANVSENYTVNLVVGNGIPDNGTATFSIALPNVGNKTGTVKTFLNNMAYDTKENVVLDGSTLQLSFTGSGADNTFTIYVDSTKIYSGNIDFTKEHNMISNVMKYSYALKEYIPDVTGLDVNLAREALKNRGFGNITVEYQISETVEKDAVISQSPVGSNLTQYSTNVGVVLIVSMGSAAEQTTEPEPTTGEEPTSGEEPTGDEPVVTTEPIEEETDEG